MIVSVKVVPNAKEDSVVGEVEGVLKLRVMAPPDKGKANKAVLELLAKHFKIPKRSIFIKSGHTSRLKQIVIEM